MDIDRALLAYYVQQARGSPQIGYGLYPINVYRGQRFQQSGNGIFGTIFKALLPFLKETGKSLGKAALSTTANVASDLVSGQSTFKDSLKRHGVSGAKAFAQKTLGDISDRIGKGFRRRGVKRKGNHLIKKMDFFYNVLFPFVSRSPFRLWN